MERDPIGRAASARTSARPAACSRPTEGLLDQFGPERVRDTPISEQAIVGAAMGAAMTGLRPIAELMFSRLLRRGLGHGRQPDRQDPLHDRRPGVAAARASGPRTARGLRFGAQHSQSIENWAMAIPGLKVVAPSTPADMRRADGRRDPRPRPGDRLRAQGAVRDQGRGARRRARRAARPGGGRPRGHGLHDRRPRGDGARGPLEAAERLAGGARHLGRGHRPALARPARRRRRSSRSVAKTSRLFTVEENPRLCGWGAEIVSIVADEGFWSLDAPIVRITTPHIPLPSAAALEDARDPDRRPDRRHGPARGSSEAK